MANRERRKGRAAAEDDGAGPRQEKKRGRAAIGLRILREFSGLGQKQLAARTEVNDRRVGSYERGSSQLEAGHLEELLAAMHLPYAAWAETMDFLDRLEWHRRKHTGSHGAAGEESRPGLIADVAAPEPEDPLREAEWIAKSAGRAEEQKTYDTLRMLLLAKVGK